MITTAVALSAGEDFPDIISSMEAHPSMDICGVARSVPDLLRLLSRFKPPLLIASPYLLEEMVHEGIPEGSSPLLSSPVTLMLLSEGEGADGVELVRIMHLPLRVGGALERETREIDGVYQYIKAKVDVYNNAVFSSPRQRTSRVSQTDFLIFTGCKGGVGNTFISCSFAAAAAMDKRVLLMEMGGFRSQLSNIKPSLDGKTFAELAPLAEDISWDLLRISLYKHPSGFYLLPSGRGYDKDASNMTRSIMPLLRNLLFLFDLVVVDLQSPWGGELSLTVPLLPQVMLVTLPDVLSAACARDAAEFMRRIGMEASRMRLLVNRNGGNHTLGIEELGRATGLQIAAVFPDDMRSGLDFRELGELPRPESEVGRAAVSLACTLGLAPPASSGAGIHARLGMLGRRRKNKLGARTGGDKEIPGRTDFFNMG